MKKYLFADTVTGVFSADLEDANQEVMSAQDFYDSLRDLEDGVTICAFFSEAEADIFEKIEKEYGVK